MASFTIEVAYAVEADTWQEALRKYQSQDGEHGAHTYEMEKVNISITNEEGELVYTSLVQ